jgi:hypothetical protein
MASKTSLAVSQAANQKLLRKEGVEILRSMRLSEWLELCRPADKAEESRYCRAWIEANTEPSKQSPQRLIVSDHVALHQPFMSVNFMD